MGGNGDRADGDGVVQAPGAPGCPSADGVCRQPIFCQRDNLGFDQVTQLDAAGMEWG